jgi:photosystem II stability/assembly factor-like uncharacterized protein
MLIASPFLAFALAAAQGAPSGGWVVARGTDTCSVSSVDFADGPHGFAAGSFNCGLLTDDGGYTWTPVRVVPDQSQSLMWVHAAGPDDLYAARRDLYRSTDRGQTWSAVGTLATQGGGNIFDVHLFDADHLVVIKGGQIWTTADAGATWTLAYPGEQNVNFHELHFPTAQTGYVTGGIVRDAGEIGAVLRSDDGGASWTRLDFPYGKITAADFVDADHALVATQSQGLFATADGGRSWQSLLSAPDGLVNQLRHRDAQDWYATTYEGCVYRSRDGGTTWRQGYCDPQQRALASLSLRGGAAVAAGNDGLVIVEDTLFGDGFEQP